MRHSWQALADDFDQIVLFRAGFDTRALRFQSESGWPKQDVVLRQQHKRIFRLDVGKPETIHMSGAMLRKATFIIVSQCPSGTGR
jgi:hypothetical protein